MYKNISKIHFVGIGGIGMSGIAEILINLGYEVSGSDIKPGPITKRLRRLGAHVKYGHKAEYAEKADVVVTSSAIGGKNPEVIHAANRGIPVIARAEMLAELMRMKYGIAVAGSHGKTTTTSLIAEVLTHAKLDPTIIIGGRVRSLRSNARLGKGEFLVAEADESDGSFLHLHPTIAVVTNIDHEHLDHYKDYEELKSAFDNFCRQIPFYGTAIFCIDHPAAKNLAGAFPRRHFTYGIESKKGDFTARSIRFERGMTRFTAIFRGKVLGEVSIRLLGKHNVTNALAAIAVAHELGIPFSRTKKALKRFKGIGRRMEILYSGTPIIRSRRSGSAGLRRGGMGAIGGFAEGGPHGAPIIIDDYGHHPEEIRATIEAVRNVWKGFRIRVVFQPHRYTRTRDLFPDFTRCFYGCDELVIADIYPASEPPIVGISGHRLAEAIRRPRNVRYFSELPEIADHLWQTRGKRDLFLVLGAGNIGTVARELTRRAKESYDH